METSSINIPSHMRGNKTVGAGLSSWVLRLDAVAKCYSSAEDDYKAREIAVYERLGSAGDHHKGVMRYYGVLDNAGVLVQFARHGSIRQYYSRLEQHEDVPLSTRTRWIEQTAEAIAFIHSKGVIHCDISSNNVFLDENLNAIVGDFSGSSLDGSPCLSWYEASHSHPDMSIPSIPTDIFALGSTFYEILLGKKPFAGLDECSIEESIRAGRFPNLEALPSLQMCINKCWHQHYESVDEVLEDIRQQVTLGLAPTDFDLPANAH
ncbi:hypothetical protein F66182_5412 [Fusarium sp. NRRL 66182]|nr:hypothetical protein F66182_5412 [Fusarium sp. NRRL 66182]